MKERKGRPPQPVRMFLILFPKQMNMSGNICKNARGKGNPAKEAAIL
jgi:hypothetical protein